MTKTEYKDARKQLNMSVDEWIAALDISSDTHKSLCSGRRDIQPRIRLRIELLREEYEKQKQA